MNKQLSFYHPTTAVFVDDKPEFLTALQFRLPASLPKEKFSNPLEALDVIQKKAITPRNKLDHIVNLEELSEEFDNRTAQDTYVSFCLNKLSEISCDSHRFYVQSVVIVDYTMPDIDGISFCKKLKEYSIKKIMLTSNTDHTMATQAFNDGIIDCFLNKNDPDLINKLAHKIDKLQKSYFSSLMENRLGAILQNIVPIFTNDTMSKFHEKIMNEFNAVEFYILDKWGSTLFITYEGIPITLVISSTDNIESYAQIAKDQDEINIANALFKKEKLIYFPSDFDIFKPASEWNSFLFDANKFPESSELYYAINRNQASQRLNSNQIQAQKDCLYHNN